MLPGRLKLKLSESDIPQQSDMALRPRLLDQVRDVMRRNHYSLRTEKAYVWWIKRFARHFELRHPATMGSEEVTAFLTHLARHERVSASTQNQALSALLFLYGKVLGQSLPWLDEVERAKRPPKLPTVVLVSKVNRLLGCLRGSSRLVTCLLYGAGLRLMEGLSLRTQDLVFEREQIIVRAGKGARGRVTVLPSSLEAPFRRHLEDVGQLHEADLKKGFGRAALPFALERKRAVAQAAHDARIERSVSPHTLRHCFATHLPAPRRDCRLQDYAKATIKDSRDRPSGQ
jgi:site-specific recombinase XerD